MIVIASPCRPSSSIGGALLESINQDHAMPTSRGKAQRTSRNNDEFDWDESGTNSGQQLSLS
ncbi:hypothetical protein [Afipia sp. P52-10]|uniref:hypothetical protein n=1 Tax=Afipia sp. P52-10 TaxID=1429916 RepID=UPI001269671A|nr:hypothetical protein [Afipia sp. P52-10]